MTQMIMIGDPGAAGPVPDHRRRPGAARPDRGRGVVAVSDAQRMSEWGATAKPVLTKISTDMYGLASAADNTDLPGLRSTCRTLEGDLDSLDGLLPTPNTGLTTELRGAVDDYRQMTVICRTLSPYSSVDEVNQMTALINSGTAHVVAATEPIKGAVSTASGAR